MLPELERIVAEDELARAAVEAAAARAEARVAAARRDLAATREQRVGELVRQVDATVESLRADCDREVAARRIRRDAFAREHAAARTLALADGVDLFLAIVRGDARTRSVR